MENQRKCQARLLLPQAKIFLGEAQVFLTTMCGRGVLDEKTCDSLGLCRQCAGIWGEPIHGFVCNEPPALSHCYGSGWFEEQIKMGAKISVRDRLWLKTCADAAAAGRIHAWRQAQLDEEARPKPKEAKPPVRIIIKMPSKKQTAAQPPPPPSSPTHGSLPVPPKPAVPKDGVKKKRTKPAAATPSRKRSPTARIADRTPSAANAIAIGDDFERTQQRAAMLSSLLHVFEPAFFEEDGEPLEIDEYEYVKLHHDGSEHRLVDESTGAKFSYSVESGILPL